MHALVPIHKISSNRGSVIMGVSDLVWRMVVVLGGSDGIWIRLVTIIVK